MKLVELKCKNCGSKLEVNPEENEVTCQYCQAKFKLDDEVKHVKFDDMEQNGYEFEKGRIRAQQESFERTSSTNVQKTKKKRTFWLILAWIYLFPFTATYFIAKSEKLDKKKKIMIILIMWAFLLVVALTNRN